jgi:hypothetical protein
MKASFLKHGVILLVFVLVACSDTEFFLPAEEPEVAVAIATLDDGAVLSAQSRTVPVAIEQDDDEARLDSMAIELYDDAGTLRSTASLTEEDLADPQLPGIELPELETGHYTLSMTAFRDDTVAAVRELEFFYVNGSYEIVGVSSFPPEILPESSVLFRADVQVPEGADPFLRWSMAGEVVSEGLLSDGFDTMYWSAPPAVGVYTVTAQLFPVAPVDQAPFTFDSSIHMDADIFVSSTISPGYFDLGPEGSYYSLYHLWGTLADSGVRPGKSDAVPIGEPVLAVDGELFGYRLDGETGLRIDDVILPRQEGVVGPFSITAVVQLDEAQQDASLLRVSSRAEDLALQMGWNDLGVLAAELRVGSSAVELTAPGASVPVGVPVELVLSFLPLSDDQVELRWFLDGRQTAAAQYELDLRPVGVDGISVVGGAAGFVGIVDEIGVYAFGEDGEPSADPHVFRRAMEEQLGRDLVLAEGFDSAAAPDAFQVDSDAPVVDAGALVVPAGTYVDLPAVPLEDGLSTVSLALDPDSLADLELVLLAEDDTPLAALPVHRFPPGPATDVDDDVDSGETPQDGPAGQDDEAEPADDGAERPYLVFSDGALALSLAYDDGQLVIVSNADGETRASLPAETRLVRIRIRNGSDGEDAAARLDSIVVAKDRPAPVAEDPIPLATQESAESVET